MAKFYLEREILGVLSLCSLWVFLGGGGRVRGV